MTAYTTNLPVPANVVVSAVVDDECPVVYVSIRAGQTLIGEMDIETRCRPESRQMLHAACADVRAQAMASAEFAERVAANDRVETRDADYANHVRNVTRGYSVA